MANWISKATGAFRGDDSSASVAFELECECGQQHTGLRRQKWQRIVCRSCGGSLFVLQRDPYPQPKEIPEARSARPIEDEDLYELPAEAQESPPAVKKPARKQAVAPPAPRQVVAEPLEKPLRIPAQKGFWKPFRLVMVGVVALGALMVYVVIRGQKNESARRVLQAASQGIDEALANANWVEARGLLQDAVAAAERLGQQDETSIRYRQLYRETTALTDLLSVPLTEMLDEADNTYDKEVPEKWNNAFQAKYYQHWLFIEGTAVERPAPSEAANLKKTGEFLIELPLMVGRKQRRVELIIRSAELTKLCSQRKGAQQVIVAVPLNHLEQSEDGKSWRIFAVPNETVLWSDRRTYEGLGYLPEESLLAAPRLQEQQKSLGLGKNQ